MSTACLQGSNENEAKFHLTAAFEAVSRWRRWNEFTFSPTFVLSLVQKWKHPEFPTSEVKGCFLSRYVTFSPRFHFICVPYSPWLFEENDVLQMRPCVLPDTLEGWKEELFNFPSLAVGNPQWWVSGNKIKWLETQKWVSIVLEAKNASKAGFSRQPWQAAGTRLKGLLVATCFYYLKTCTPARNSSLWTKCSSFLALSTLEANRNGKVHKV